MAITIVSQPAEDTAAGKCFAWEIEVSAPANPEQTKRKFLYQLKRTTNDADITPIEQISYTGETILLDFTNDCVPHLPGFVPNLTSVYSGTDLQYTAFYLRLAEVDIDLTTCTPPDDPVWANGGNKRLWNIYPQTGEYPIANIATTPFLMTYKPPGVIKMARDQRDFLYFCPADVGMDMVVKQYDLTGTLIATNAYGYAGGIKTINVFGISGNNTGGVTDVNNLSRMELDMTIRPSDTPLAKYIIEFYDSCTGQEGRELYFVEPLGCVSSIRFDESEFLPTRQVSIASEEVACSDTTNAGYTTGGLKSVNNNSFRRIVLRKYIDRLDEWAKFYEGFQASNFVWIAQKSSGGTMQMANFILDNASITSKNDSVGGFLTVSGRLHKNIKTPEKYSG
jgi:hypothetical protein